MAAPTNVWAEADGRESVNLFWDYSGSNYISVYRSTDGISYAEVTTGADRPASTVKTYNDTTVAADTKYWYKLTDDVGSTFSSAVTVWTHGCGPGAGSPSEFSLPRFYNITEETSDLNESMKRIEEITRDRILTEGLCLACVSDGKVYLDCSDGCTHWLVYASEDISSITIEGCDESETDIDFVIPPNVTRKIGGFKTGEGWGTDARGTAVTTGSSPRTVSVTRKCKCADLAQGAVGVTPGYGCLCEGTGGNSKKVPALSVEGGNNMDCGSTKSLVLTAKGGHPPYTWSASGSLVLSNTVGNMTKVTPPANTGSAVAGEAYAMASWHKCNGGANNTQRETYGCDDVVETARTQTISNGAFLTAAPACQANLTASDFPIATIDHSDPACSPNCDGCPNPITPDMKTMCDMRSGAMISGGCNPCGTSVGGQTVTLTDSSGQTVVKTLRAR